MYISFPTSPFLNTQYPIYVELSQLLNVDVPAHIVPGGEDLELQLENEVDQEPLLTVLEYPDLLEGLQVHVDCNLRLEFVRQHLQHRLLVHGLFVAPEIIKPLDHPLLEVLPNPAEPHVLLDGVHLVPELRPGGVHVGDHGADVSHNGGEYEDPEKEVDGDEEILRVLLWLWSLPDGGESEGGPVEAVDVLGGE